GGPGARQDGQRRRRDPEPDAQGRGPRDPEDLEVGRRQWRAERGAGGRGRSRDPEDHRGQGASREASAAGADGTGLPDPPPEESFDDRALGRRVRSEGVAWGRKSIRTGSASGSTGPGILAG